jgi:hypothetical protein
MRLSCHRRDARVRAGAGSTSPKRSMSSWPATWRRGRSGHPVVKICELRELACLHGPASGVECRLRYSNGPGYAENWPDRRGAPAGRTRSRSGGFWQSAARPRSRASRGRIGLACLGWTSPCRAHADARTKSRLKTTIARSYVPSLAQRHRWMRAAGHAVSGGQERIRCCRDRLGRGWRVACQRRVDVCGAVQRAVEELRTPAGWQRWLAVRRTFGSTACATRS